MNKYISEWQKNGRIIRPSYNPTMTLENGFFVIRGTLDGRKVEDKITLASLLQIIKKQRIIIANIKNQTT